MAHACTSSTRAGSTSNKNHVFDSEKSKARIQSELLDSARQGDWPRFVPLLEQVDDLAEHTFIPPMEGYVQRMLWALVHQGVLDRSVTCDPWGPALPEAEFAALGACLARYPRW